MRIILRNDDTMRYRLSTVRSLFVRSLVRSPFSFRRSPFVRLCVRSFVRSFVRLFVRSSVHLQARLQLQQQ